MAAASCAASPGRCRLRGPLTRALFRWPFLMMVLLLLVPHAISGVVNIAYRSLRIVDRLTPAQRNAYQIIVPLYIGVDVYGMRRWW